jgi:pimeloyl-ACP methyl ester carboxylesterase
MVRTSQCIAACIVAISLNTLSRVSSAQVTRSASPGKLVQHTVTVDGYPIAVWEERAPHPRRNLVLVHGRTWSSRPDFDLQVAGEKLSVMDALVGRGYDVYAIDLRGYGATPRDTSGWLTPTRAAADIAGVIDWVQRRGPMKEKPALIGWSRGSMLSQLVAQNHPDAISALVLFGRPQWDSLPTDNRSGAAPRKPNTAEAAGSDFITPGSISRTARDAYVRQALASDPVLVEWRNLDEFNALDASRVTVPTLFMMGQLDPLYVDAKTKQAEFFLRLGTPDKEWVILPGGDHAALLERPAPRFIEAITSFLERPRF